MQMFFINALKITVVTNSGIFGTFLKFDNGLNIIRAENTSGKSTTLNSILYALGFEILTGKTGMDSVKPALRSTLEYDGQIYSVLESYVELEIFNSKKEAITIKRYVKGNVDNKLIKVNYGCFLTHKDGELGKDEFYYLGRNSSIRSTGFHSFLVNFLDLKLPMVSRFEGDDVPLYVECFLPLMFIEQVRGWSGLQATLPKFYGIQNANKISLEFLLKLDVSEILHKKQEIQTEKRGLRNTWESFKKTLDEIVHPINGILNNYPVSPTANLENNMLPNILMHKDAKWVNLDSWLIDSRDELINLKSELEEKPKTPKELEQQLGNLENELFFKQALHSKAKASFLEEKSYINELQQRIAFIMEEISKNNDVLRLQKYGADLDYSTLKGLCPTCHQSTDDTLLEQTSSPMTIQQNVNFLKQQQDAIEILLDNSLKILQAKKQEYEVLESETNNIRRNIRDLKSDLIKDKKLTNIGSIRKLVEKENFLELVEKQRDRFQREIENLLVLSSKWKELLGRESELPKDMFSFEDKKKLEKLGDLFSNFMAEFGFSSISPKSFKISLDNYRPTLEGFEVSFEASASDHIRLIWAYTLALQALKDFFDTNHLGFTIFDEPGQQEINEQSREAFYKTINTLNYENNQIIIATSEEPHRLMQILKNVTCNLIELGNKVIRPMKVV